MNQIQIEVLTFLLNKNYTISACESITGGLFSKSITDLSHASNIFKGAYISYTNESKEQVVGVAPETITAHGAVSSECALAMAKATQTKFKTHISIATTGNAGPTASETKPVGCVYIAIIWAKESFVYQYQFLGNRQKVRILTVNKIYQLLLKRIKTLKENTKEAT